MTADAEKCICCRGPITGHRIAFANDRVACSLECATTYQNYEDLGDDPPYKPTPPELVAAAAYTSVPGLTDQESLDAVAEIIYGAPEHLRDDFQVCCALYLYRQALIKAVSKNDIGQIVNTQSLILGVISQ